MCPTEVITLKGAMIILVCTVLHSLGNNDEDKIGGKLTFGFECSYYCFMRKLAFSCLKICLF